MAGTVAGFDTPVAINKQNYDLILAQLQKRGLENQTAKMMAYDILINILRSATNKLGLEDTATPNVHVSRAIV